jgi:hypothetical protein
MSLHYVSKFVLAFILCGCVCTASSINNNIARAESKEMPGVGAFDVKYPGWNDDFTSVEEVSSTLAAWGVSYYYKIHGSWPKSWNQVVSDGIVQTPILGWMLENINPDDPSLDFLGDFYLDTSYCSAGRNPFLRILTNYSGPYIYHKKCPKPSNTYLEVFAEIDERFYQGGDSFESQFPNLDEQMKMFAIIGMAKKGIGLYFTIHGDFPKSWTEFINSGLSPVNETSINPITGSRIYGDGRANDIYYKYTVNEDGKPIYLLYHIGPDGALPTVWFAY